RRVPRGGPRVRPLVRRAFRRKKARAAQPDPAPARPDPVRGGAAQAGQAAQAAETARVSRPELSLQVRRRGFLTRAPRLPASQLVVRWQVTPAAATPIGCRNFDM